MKRTRLAPLLEEISQSYLDWITENPIVPSFPYRNSLRFDYNLENPDAVPCSLYTSEVNKWTAIRILGRGTTGKNCRESHMQLVSDLKNHLMYPILLTKIMEFSQNEFGLLYFFNRLGMLSDTSCIRRSSEDSVSKTLSKKMKMLGLRFFLVNKLVTSTHETNFSMRKRFTKNFLAYILKDLCKGELKKFGYQAGRMRRNYHFRFPSEIFNIFLPAYRLNFQPRITIMKEYSRQLSSAIKLRDLSSFISQFPENCKYDVYVFDSTYLPNTLNPESVALVENISYMIFKKFTEKKLLLNYLNKEYVRKVLGLLIGNSEQKIENAISELFFHSSKTNLPRCIQIVFLLLEKCDNLDPDFFNSQVDMMLSESLSVPNDFNQYEKELLSKKRISFQNILLFVIYLHKRQSKNPNFLRSFSNFLFFISSCM